MSVLHFGGERTGRSCGQGVPRAYRDVQTRVILDAIVSTKTFRNATCVPDSPQKFLAIHPLQRSVSFNCFKEALLSPIVHFCGKEASHEAKNSLKEAVPKWADSDAKSGLSLSF
jgi:hypothetical protein